MLKDIFLLKGLSEDEKEKIISMFSQSYKFKKGDMIYSADTFKLALGVILKGTASATSENSDSFFKKSFSTGSVFGAAAIFGDSGPYVSQIIANTDCEVLFIEETLLKKIFALYPQTSLNYISFLSDKIRFLNQKLNMISCSAAEDTVYKYLIENMNDAHIVSLSVSMSLLAKMLGLSRATLYRSFDALESKGKIIKQNNEIKVI